MNPDDLSARISHSIEGVRNSFAAALNAGNKPTAQQARDAFNAAEAVLRKTVGILVEDLDELADYVAYLTATGLDPESAYTWCAAHAPADDLAVIGERMRAAREHFVRELSRIPN